MSVWRRLGVGLAIVAVATLSGGWAAGAGAQSAGCLNGGSLGTPQITIDAPAPNDSVSGTVTVRGTARLGLLGQLDRVEVTLGSLTRVQTFDAGSVLNFSVPVDASSLPGGGTSLRVVACGGFAYGEKTISVNVAAPAVTTTAPRATTTTAGGGGPGTSVAGATTTSVATGAVGAQAGATTSTKVSTTTTAAPPTTAVATTLALTTTTVAGRNTPLVLTETPSKSKSGAPVWVGAVVGISGGLGLLFSARPWRRRGGPGAPDAAIEEPTEQLVR